MDHGIKVYWPLVPIFSTQSEVSDPNPQTGSVLGGRVNVSSNEGSSGPYNRSAVNHALQGTVWI